MGPSRRAQSEANSPGKNGESRLAFDVGFSPDVRGTPVTGRVYVVLSRAPEEADAPSTKRTPMDRVGPTGVPIFGKNVDALAPGARTTIDHTAFGFPLRDLRELPAGDYWVQAAIQIYTRFERADGHVLWLPMDQGEGQDWRKKPGNLFCTPQRVSYDPDEGARVELVCDSAIPPLEWPADTEQIKRLRLESPLLSAFWGQPMELGATVLLPHGFDEHPEARYPVVYAQGHFSRRAPGGYGHDEEFTKWWQASDTPRFLLVTFQHPTPFYDDSYAVNSANAGPYGDALTGELIPAVEERFRAIGAPWARFLTGGSTGGWEALALQIFHPTFFNGAWALCPDAVDFRYHQIVDVYEDENAYFLDHGWLRTARPCLRRTDGEVVYTMQDENHYELAIGDRTRSGGQWDAWEATYSPVGPDGYPKPIWNKESGAIDHEVAEYWRDNYDLRHRLETHWATLGPELVGKLHVYVGDMDGYYLNEAVELLNDFLESTANPPYGGEVRFERGAPHCWGPPLRELLPAMAERALKTAPSAADRTSWRH